MSAGGRNNGSFDGAGAWNAHHSGAGRPIGTQSSSENGKGEISGDADDGEQAGVRASLADSHREGMQDSGSAIAQVSCSEPRTLMHVSDEPGCLAGFQEEEEKAHYLHGPDSLGTEIVNIGRASNAQGDGESSDEGIVREIPKKGRGGPPHAKPTLEELQDPVLATNDGPNPPV